MAGMAGDVRVGILGLLEVRVGFGQPVEVVGSRLRTLLVRLALDPDRVVLASQLVDAVWGEDPPARAGGALQSLVFRLRRLLPDVVESHPAGYRLALDPEAVDAVQFERLARAGRAELRRDPRQAGDTLREALALWRGPALADVAGARFADAAATRLEELRLGALEDRIDADLATGGSDTVVAELDELVAVHPLRERLSGQLMRALARAGRQADALAVYERLRARLADELGIDPSPELQAAHLGVLRGEASRGTAAYGTAREGRYDRETPVTRTGPGARGRLGGDRETSVTPGARGAREAPAAPRIPGAREAPAAPRTPAAREGPAAPGTLIGPPPAEPGQGLGAVRTNLRAQITSFVGRDEDLARITGVFAGVRLVTLVGPGGAGKTRLAGEAAARMLDRLPDGAWMVELGSVADPVELAQTVLSLLGARELGLLPPRGASAVAPLERLVEVLGDKRLLLVMDNCEHLLADVAALVDRLLARCPALLVLATSREPLGITGEVLLPVGPLAMPDQEVGPAEAVRYPAVRLFADRGAAVRPAFAVDQATVAPVLRICRALDGMPLAIELAAARLRALSPEQVAARLDDRFRLLGNGGRAGLPRHQTLRAVIDWSWDLLGDAERVLARRFAVFSGGATLEAVELVCAGPALGGPAPDEVLYLLATLVDKSLVVAAHDEGGGEVRYAMLETVRAYGDERRRAAGEDEAVRRAHAGYFLDLAERAEPHLRREDQLRWIALLTAERDNLRAALRWAVDNGDATLAQRLVAALTWYWFLRSHRAEGSEWAAQALALPGQAPAAVRAQVLSARVMLALSGITNFAAVRELVDQALAVVSGLPGDEPRLAHPSLALLPTLAALFRNDAEHEELVHVRELEGHPDPWVRALAHLMSGQLLVNLGQVAEAEAEMDLGVAGFRQLGERWGLGQALFGRTELSATRGQYDAAVAALLEARDVFAGLGDREDVGALMIRLAQVRAQAGETGQALRDLEVAGRIAHEVGAEDQKRWILYTLGELARWQGRVDEARERLDAAIAGMAPGEHLIDQLHALMLTARGHVDVAAGDPEGAYGWYQRAVRVALASKDRPVIARAVELLARLALAGGDAERAASLLGAAEVLRGLPDEANVDVVRVRAAARAALGDEGFTRVLQRGRARPPDEVLAEVRSGAGTPAAPAERTPPR
jgi:predicted ATPase/DNA-binding SARP family transcriptional activator